jgi:hypothetical protein
VATRRQGADSASSAGGSISEWTRPAQAASAVAQVLQSSGNGGARSQASARAALGGGSQHARRAGEQQVSIGGGGA